VLSFRIVTKCENFLFFITFFSEKVWRFKKKSYLCIRFRPENGVQAQKESSLKELHKTEEVVVQEARESDSLG